MSMPICMRCDREFASHRGLDIHRNRAHPVSDSYALDYLNLNLSQQEMVLCHLEDIEGRDGSQSFARHQFTDPKQRATLVEQIMTNPLDREQRARFITALGVVTGVEYRYVIQEQP